MSIKDLVSNIKHNGLLTSMAQLEKLYRIAIENEEKLAESEAKCAALAAENAEMKEEISNITFMRDDDFFGSTQRAQEVMGRLVNIKTQATDAFLAEARAQGVDMAAKSDQFSTWVQQGLRSFAIGVRQGVQS